MSAAVPYRLRKGKLYEKTLHLLTRTVSQELISNKGSEDEEIQDKGIKVYNNLPLYIEAVSKDLKKSEGKIEAVFTKIFFLFITGIFLL
jgi:hypothetical protein